MNLIDLTLTVLGLLLPIVLGILILVWNHRFLKPKKENFWVAFALTVTFLFPTVRVIFENTLDTIRNLIIQIQVRDTATQLFNFEVASDLFFQVIRFFMVWIALNYFIDRSGFKKKENVSHDRRNLRKNALTIFTIVLATYLGITALITAPIVRGEGVNPDSDFHMDLQRELEETIAFDQYQLERFDSLLHYREKQAELLHSLTYWGGMITHQLRDSITWKHPDAKNQDSLVDIAFKSKMTALEHLLKQNKREAILTNGLLGQTKPFKMYLDYKQPDSTPGELFPSQLMDHIEQEFSQLNTLNSIVQSRSRVQHADVRDFIQQFLFMQRHKAIQQMQEVEKSNLVNSLKLRHKADLYEWYVELRAQQFEYFIKQIDCTRDVINEFSTAIIDPTDLDRALELFYLTNYYHARLNKAKNGDLDDFENNGEFLAATTYNTALYNFYEKSSATLIEDLNQNLTYSAKFIALDSRLSASKVEWDSLQKYPPVFNAIPTTPEQGENLGVFRFIMGWLLKIQDYSVVLIVGLVGFGLMGAAGATFIKEVGAKEEKAKQDKTERKDETDTLLVKDLPGVLIKGFSAALIVFLGFQGSMALFTGSSSTPPDESLFFFLALAASVYSDTTWQWAYRKLIDRLNKSDDQAEGEKDTTTAEKDASANDDEPSIDKTEETEERTSELEADLQSDALKTKEDPINKDQENEKNNKDTDDPSKPDDQ